MKMTFDAILKYLSYFWIRRKTKNGYFLGILLLVIILDSLTPINSLTIFWRLITYLFLFIVAFISWIFISGRRIFPTKKLKIAFALKSSDPSSQKVITSTIMRIKDKLKTLNILKHFKFYEIGTDIFETNEQAEKFGLKRKINLIIHGTVYGGKIESSYRYDLKNFFFTYNVVNAPKDSSVWAIILKDIEIMLANRNWIIDESNDLNDIVGVADNLFEIILSIISIGLTRSKKTIDYSILLIEKLLPILEKKIDPEHRKIYLSEDKTQVKIPIDLLRTGRLKEILNGCYINIARIYINDGEYPKAINIVEKGIAAGADKIGSYAALALANYYLNDIEKAETFTDKINEISNKHPIFLVNKAFFAIQRKQYEQVTKYYDDLRREIKSDDMLIKQVLDFLSARKNEDKNEHAYLYSIGILTYNFIDKKSGEKILLQFFEKVKDNNSYKSMVSIASQLCKIK